MSMKTSKESSEKGKETCPQASTAPKKPDNCIYTSSDSDDNVVLSTTRTRLERDAALRDKAKELRRRFLSRKKVQRDLNIAMMKQTILSRKRGEPVSIMQRTRSSISHDRAMRKKVVKNGETKLELRKKKRKPVVKTFRRVKKDTAEASTSGIQKGPRRR